MKFMLSNIFDSIYDHAKVEIQNFPCRKVFTKKLVVEIGY